MTVERLMSQLGNQKVIEKSYCNVWSNHCIQAAWVPTTELCFMYQKVQPFEKSYETQGMVSSTFLPFTTLQSTSKPQTNARHLPSVVGVSGRSCWYSKIVNQRPLNHLSWYMDPHVFQSVLFCIAPLCFFKHVIKHKQTHKEHANY